MKNEIACGSVTYELVEFYAVETFDHTKYNTNPHNPDNPLINGHNRRSVGSIDDSLQGASPKQALDFLSQHKGKFRKEHSLVHAVHAVYHQKKSDTAVIRVPVSTEISFPEYVRLGKPEVLTLRLTAETP